MDKSRTTEFRGKVSSSIALGDFAFLLVGFLGSGIAVRYEGVGLNASNLAAFVYALFIMVTAFKHQFLLPLTYFLACCLPGTIVFLYLGGPAVIPLQQIAGLAIFSVAISGLFARTKLSAELYFVVYILIARFAAIVAIAQSIAYIFSIEAIYDLSWIIVGRQELNATGPFLRAYSLFTEPSYFGVFLLPAVYLAIGGWLGEKKYMSKRDTVLVTLGLISTASAITLFGALVCLVMQWRARLNRTIMVAVLAAILTATALGSEAVMSRIDGLSAILFDEPTGDENTSALIRLFNYNVTEILIAEKPLLGSGLGAYRFASQSAMDSYVFDTPSLAWIAKELSDDELSLADGGSLALRMPVEMGLIGLFFLWVPFLTKRLDQGSVGRALEGACIVFFVGYSLRTGQLIRFDFQFFLMLYLGIRFPRFGRAIGLADWDTKTASSNSRGSGVSVSGK